jgi:tetratricopeptide (TPR) repeat protein
MDHKMHYYPEGTVIRHQPKIYFTCLSADFASCLEAVKQDLFRPGIREKSNFVLCYHRPEDLPPADEQYWADLGNMKLLVVAVTGGLLDGGDHRALAVLNFGRDHGIPVLPLLMEQNLEHRFDMLCGSLHCLNRTLRESSGFSYEEKVEKFLAAVLISNEMAERIRKEFDARIFLSYRKKDRDDALELMKLIHQRPACRDVAIWYDDFLTPGEDFDEGILEILHSSDLFVLTVTPSILEPRLDSKGRPAKNYVEETEYPEAKKILPVLPAMMRPTDPALLRSQFPGTENTWVDARDDHAMTVALHRDLPQAVEKLARRENDNDPHHNYLIGLAYLAGIDVEVDGQRARLLLEEAAAGGHVEAAEKLADMYRIGNGVSQNTDMTLKWLAKAVELRTDAYHREPSLLNLHLLYVARHQYGDVLREEGKLPDAWKNLQETVDLLLNSPFRSEPDIRRNLSLSYDLLARIALQREPLPEARKLFYSALKERRWLATNMGDPVAKHDLALSYMNMAEIEEGDRQYDEAIRLYNEAIVVLEQVLEVADDYRMKITLAVAKGKLGNILLAKGQIAEGTDLAEGSLALYQQVDETLGNDYSRRHLITGYIFLGDAYKADGDIHGACAYYDTAYEIAVELEKKYGSLQTKHDLSVCCGKIVEVCLLAENALDAAEIYCRQGMELDEQMWARSKQWEYRRNLSVSYRDYADILKKKWEASGDPQQLKRSRRYYERSLDIAREQYRETGRPQSGLDVAALHSRLGKLTLAEYRVSKNKRLLKQAEESLMAGWRINDQLVKKYGTVKARYDLAIAEEDLAELCAEKKDTPGRVIHYRKALELWQALEQDAEGAEVRGRAVQVACRLGIVTKDRDLMDRTLQAAAQLAADHPDRQDLLRMFILVAQAHQELFGE